jgi:hypothetical protein
MLMRFAGRHFFVCHRLVIAAALICGGGCTSAPQQQWESLKGDGFPGWSERLASGARGNVQGAQASGFFTDRRSEQIEKDLGGF